jgi:hypothetical protein
MGLRLPQTADEQGHDFSHVVVRVVWAPGDEVADGAEEAVGRDGCDHLT